jgi:4-hydroxy-3-polyprenylbenzoate decarboxylase
MAYRSLAEFVEDLRHIGELVRVDEEVDPARGPAEMAGKIAPGGPALLFGAVKGHDLPLLCNLLGSDARICRALGVASLDELTGRIARLLCTTAAEGWFERLKGGTQPPALDSFAPRKVKSAACQQIVRLGSDVDLGELPLLETVLPEETATGSPRPLETSPAVTGATVFSAEPDSHQPVAGRFDLVRLDRARLAVCWAAYEEHARLLGDYRRREQKMPLAVVIGGDPAFLLAAAAPLPSGSDVCAVAGLLRERPLDVVACRSVDLLVPAEAEIVLEGFLDPTQPPVMAGRLCGPTGHLTHPRPAPVMQVTTVTQRANPIYAVMFFGRPPHEAATVARAMQQVFLPLARLAMPDLVDYDLPQFAAARLWASVAIRKTYPGQGPRAAHAAWGLPATRFAKILVIVDEDVDVHDHEQVLAAVALNVRPGRDVLVERGPADPFDPASPSDALAEKMALDATRKLANE